ncbi:MAG TPA: dephospho-CoA kinase [Candidatus Berkiella sp.]|nr:dephospho-CoA kinase [Candidatus Berkiella sp.]
MIYVVALTGGIGSGKSTVVQFFANLDVPIIDADIIAREVVKPHTQAFQQIIAKWGSTILAPNGELNRSVLREHIFTNPDDKIWLENLLHPLIQTEIKDTIQKVQYPYCIVVIPLLAEHYADYKAMIDHVIVVEAKPSQQQMRTIERDQASSELIEKMIAQQASPAQRLKIAQTVLTNNDTLSQLEKKVYDLHTILLKTGISRKI